MKWYNRSYLKVFASIYLLILLTILILSAISSFLMTDILKEKAYAELRVDNATLRKQLDLNLTYIETSIKQIAESDAVIEIDLNRVDQLSQLLIKRLDVISQIYIMDSEGMQIYKSSYPETSGDRSDRDYFKIAMAGTSVFSDVIISRSTNIPITVYACPLYREGHIDGVIGASIDLSYLSELSATLRSSNDSYGFIIDLEGHVIGHPDPVIVAERADVNYVPLVKDVLSGETGVGEYTYNGIDKLVAYTPSEKSGWGVLVQIPKKEAFQTIFIFNKLLFLTAVFILFISLVILVFLSHRLKKPVDDILDMIDKIENNQEINECSFHETDEFGIIQKKLLSMDSAIQLHYIEIEDRVQLRTAELQQALSELENTKKKLEKANITLKLMSLTDALTNLPNRRALNEYLENMLSIAKRLDFKLAVFMIDIDYFKRYNDAYGHQKGDECLVKVSECLSRHIHRQVDFLARYGGEEFIIILGDINKEGALKMAKMLCSEIEALNIPNADSPDAGPVTISIGVAWASSLINSSTEELISKADDNLYKAKELGRNCFV